MAVFAVRRCMCRFDYSTAQPRVFFFWRFKKCPPSVQLDAWSLQCTSLKTEPNQHKKHNARKIMQCMPFVLISPSWRGTGGEQERVHQNPRSIGVRCARGTSIFEFVAAHSRTATFFPNLFLTFHLLPLTSSPSLPLFFAGTTASSEPRYTAAAGEPL